MQWPEPSCGHADYAARLETVSDQNAALEAVLKTQVNRFSKFTSTWPFFTDLQAAELHEYGVLFLGLTRNWPGLFRPFLVHSGSPLVVVGLVYKALIVSRFLDGDSADMLTDLCAAPSVQQFLRSSDESGVDRLRQRVWRTICAELTEDFVTMFELLEPVEMYEVMVGNFQIFTSKEASTSLVQYVQAQVPVELNPRTKSLCVELRLRVACEDLLGRFQTLSLLDLSGNSHFALSSLQRHRGSLAFVTRRVVRSFDFRTQPLGFSLSYEVPESPMLESLREAIEQLGGNIPVLTAYLTVFQHAADRWSSWPLWTRLLRPTGTSPETQFKEVILVTHLQKLEPFFARLADAQVATVHPDFLLLASLHTENPETLDFLAATVRAGRVERVLRTGLTFQRFLASVTRPLTDSLDSECCVCKEDREEVATLCTGDFASHEVCTQCAEHMFCAKNGRLDCPICRRRVYTAAGRLPG